MSLTCVCLQKLAEELKNSSGSISAQVQSKLDEKRRVCERLGDQLYLLTGIPTESHVRFTMASSSPSALAECLFLLFSHVLCYGVRVCMYQSACLCVCVCVCERER